MPVAERGDLSPKAAKTRARILTAALELFAQKGYQATTLRDIATAAEVSLGLTYRYFQAKEELIVAVYERCADEFAVWAAELAPGPVNKRFATALRADLKHLEPLRDGFSALFQVGLNPDSEIAVLGPKVAGIRNVVWNTFLSVILGSKDAPKPKQAAELATLFYAAHLMVILFWLQDSSDGQSKTQELIDFAEDLVGKLRPVLGFPITAKLLTRFIDIISPMFGSTGLSQSLG